MKRYKKIDLLEKAARAQALLEYAISYIGNQQSQDMVRSAKYAVTTIVEELKKDVKQ